MQWETSEVLIWEIIGSYLHFKKITLVHQQWNRKISCDIFIQWNVK